MKFPLEEHFPYRVGALIVLILFYGIYFAKMLSQKRRGIRTRQIGSRREKSLHRVEFWMSVATLAVVPAQLISIFLGWNFLSPGGRFTGFCLGLMGDGLFLASVLCMRDSWRAGIPEKDRTELVTGGVYAFSRNPAFVAFDLMYVGVFFMFCNPVTGLFTLFAMVTLHLQILQEEKFCAAAFGESYLQYKSRVCRYLGRKKR